MPASVQRNGLCWARPWLAFDSAAIDAYVTRYGLRHVDDHSNRQPRFDRSRLRHAVWPTLIAAFPDAAASLSTAAARAQSMPPKEIPIRATRPTSLR